MRAGGSPNRQRPRGNVSQGVAQSLASAFATVRTGDDTQASTLRMPPFNGMWLSAPLFLTIKSTSHCVHPRAAYLS